MDSTQYKSKYGADKPILKPIQPPPKINLFPLKDISAVCVSISMDNKYNPDPYLARLDKKVYKSEEDMLKLIRANARAYLYADKSLRDSEEFNKKVVATNPRAYDYLSDRHKTKELMELYRYRDPVFPNDRPYIRSASYTMDPREYYSVDEYKKAYEAIVKNGSDHYVLHFNKGQECYIMPEVKFLKECEKYNPEFASEYAQARKEVLMQHADQLKAIICKEKELTADEMFIQKRAKVNLSEFWSREVAKYCPELAAEIQEHQYSRIAEKELTADELLAFVEENKETVAQAIADGKISMQNIVDIVGKEFDMSQTQDVEKEVDGPTLQ